MASVLVTGGAGFIGSHIVELLIEQNYDVFVIDNLSKGSLTNIPSRATFWKCDIRSQEVKNIFEQHSFEYVIHLAAQTGVNFSNSNPVEDHDINLSGLLNILELSRMYGVKRFIFSSSAATYGNPSGIPISEDQIQQPISFYGLSKLVGEQYIQMYHQIYGLEYVILRYSNVYGPRQNSSHEGGVISIFLECLNKALPYTVYGNGKQTRDYIYVKDIAKANMTALKTSY
ncbi:MAG TPA: UDP-glucose 4-epimerase, partial [Firmicutes bacterium]|nr:UDP-glucose 4-epimerase [Bacillota bacterium]